MRNEQKVQRHQKEIVIETTYRSLEFLIAILLLLREIRVIALVIGETSLSVQISGPFMGAKPLPINENVLRSSSRFFIDTVIAFLLIIGSISLTGTLFFNKQLVFLVGGPIFEMKKSSKNIIQFPNVPIVFQQEFIKPLIRHFYS